MEKRSRRTSKEVINIKKLVFKYYIKGWKAKKISEFLDINYSQILAWIRESKKLNNIPEYKGYKKKNLTHIYLNKENIDRYISENPDISLSKISKFFKIKNTHYLHFLLKNLDIFSSKGKLCKDKLREYFINNPYKSLSELGEEFNVSPSHISKVLKKMGIFKCNYKKESE